MCCEKYWPPCPFECAISKLCFPRCGSFATPDGDPSCVVSRACVVALLCCRNLCGARAPPVRPPACTPLSKAPEWPRTPRRAEDSDDDGDDDDGDDGDGEDDGVSFIAYLSLQKSLRNVTQQKIALADELRDQSLKLRKTEYQLNRATSLNKTQVCVLHLRPHAGTVQSGGIGSSWVQSAVCSAESRNAPVFVRFS